MRRNVANQRVTFSLFKSGARVDNPMMEAGDFKVAIDGGAQGPVSALPTSDAAGLVTWLPSQAETDGDTITFLGLDAVVAGNDWEPLTISFDTTSAGAILPTATMTNDQLKTAIWDVLTSDLTDAGTIGRLLVERLDATIGSRAQPGDAMTLTLAERQAVGSEVWEGTDGLAILTALFSELNAIQTQTDRIGTGDVFVVAPVRENGDVDMVIGDVYSAARNRAMTWTGEAWDIPASSAVVVVVQGVAVFNATRLAANQVRLELTSAQSATLVPGPHTFHIREIPGDGQPITHLTGAWVARTEPAPMPST